MNRLFGPSFFSRCGSPPGEPLEAIGSRTLRGRLRWSSLPDYRSREEHNEEDHEHRDDASANTWDRHEEALPSGILAWEFWGRVHDKIPPTLESRMSFLKQNARQLSVSRRLFLRGLLGKSGPRQIPFL